MPTSELLYRKDAYARMTEAEVLAHTEQGGIILDRTLFYATGGGQPGDSGKLLWAEGQCSIATTVKGEDGAVVLVPEEGSALPPVGATVTQVLNWDRRYGHMRVHTALHLLSVVIPLEVTGGSISDGKGRLDFNMPEAPEDKQALQDQLQALIDRDLEVTEDWITDAELDANPQLVKTMSVSPPRGAGQVRLVRIGTADEQIDLQPCGGTHVRRTAEIGRIRLGKVEKKGKQNRRVYLHLEA
ncbi:alanyl-tRNA editing protein [Leisingera caerulea]|uniref:Alanine--tRNA ligase n=1 Tax=Leisingera caerulea TaxID=506591 RepID=A0A9Q9HGB2_LEICA|nr:alanyl-tRNA editing protein [Leisingera caerulea]UWQ52291.1 alanyl-tRNA editing protein [Leisingera caerulea]UWQ82009.1 alanyl-tRNA editing protein [Leisingera caerulea]